MTPEQSFNGWIRSCFLDPRADYLRIETTTTNGVPDINICLEGPEVWVESKVCEGPVLLRKEQFAWGIRRSHCGGKVFLLAFRNSDRVIRAWQYPFISAKPRGDQKYLEVDNDPKWVIQRDWHTAREMVRKILFPY